jgi:hypothetical protein
MSALGGDAIDLPQAPGTIPTGRAMLKIDEPNPYESPHGIGNAAHRSALLPAEVRPLNVALVASGVAVIHAAVILLIVVNTVHIGRFFPLPPLGIQWLLAYTQPLSALAAFVGLAITIKRIPLVLWPVLLPGLVLVSWVTLLVVRDLLS